DPVRLKRVSLSVSQTLPGSYNRKRSVALTAVSLGRYSSHLDHFFGLRALRPLRHFKFDRLAFFERLEAVALNGAVVNENVRRAGLFDKPVALRVVEPLDLTGNSRHS